MSIPRPQPISDRIAAWNTAFHAVCDEVRLAYPQEMLRSAGQPDLHVIPVQRAEWMIELAARTAATLAIGATTKERE